MKIPKRLRRAATRAHADGVAGTEFVAAHADAIHAAADGSLARYRAIRLTIMRLVETGPETREKVAR